jgi:hypothetical protein
MMQPEDRYRYNRRNQYVIAAVDEAQAIGIIKAEALEGKVYRAGNSARVEVVGLRTLKGGRVVLDLRPAAKKEG